MMEEMEEMEEMGPEEGDYILGPSGPLGSRASVSVAGCAGKHLAEFRTQEEAETFIKERMEREQFWPSVWFCSDHGNLSPLSI